MPELFEVVKLYTADGEQWGSYLKPFDMNAEVVLMPGNEVVPDAVALLKECEGEGE